MWDLGSFMKEGLNYVTKICHLKGPLAYFFLIYSTKESTIFSPCSIALYAHCKGYLLVGKTAWQRAGRHKVLSIWESLCLNSLIRLGTRFVRQNNQIGQNFTTFATFKRHIHFCGISSPKNGNILGYFLNNVFKQFQIMVPCKCFKVSKVVWCKCFGLSNLALM